MNLIRMLVALGAAHLAGLGFEQHAYHNALPWLVVSVMATGLFLKEEN